MNTLDYIPRKKIRKDAFFGCPIARFMASSEKSLESPRIAKEMIDSWIDALASRCLDIKHFQHTETTNTIIQMCRDA